MSFLQDEKKKRMELALKAIEAKNGELLEVIIADLSFNMGMTERKAKEYLKTFLALEKVEMKERRIYVRH